MGSPFNQYDQVQGLVQDVDIDGAINCDPGDVDCNVVPSFHFPSTSKEPTTLLSDFKTTITNKLSSLWSSTTETSTTVSTSSTASTTQNIIQASISDIIPLPQNNPVIIDDATSNNTNVVGIIENVSDSSIVEMMQNGTFLNNTNVVGIIENVSHSSFAEIMQNGTLSVTATDNSTHLPETTFVSSASENVGSILNSTTEKAIVAITESVDNAWNTQKHNQDGDHFNHFHSHDYDHSNHWLYVLLGIIVAILVLIGIILLLIYVRYRKHSLLPVHNYYEISPMKDSCSPLPPHIHHEQEKTCTNELYSQYST